MSEQTFGDYDDGFRRGVFDKCNGRPCIIATPSDSIWDNGYMDGWNGSEVQISQPEPEAVEPAEPTRFFKLWVEWDYGQDDLIFETETAGIDWLGSTSVLADLDNPDWQTVEYIFNDGLAGFDIVTLIK